MDRLEPRSPTAIMLTARTLVRRLVPRPLRNWVRSPRKSLTRLGDELAYLTGVRLRFELRPDWTLRCHPAAYRVYRAAQLADPAQAAELDQFLRYCKPGMVLFDLGAHFGVFCLAALHHGGPEAHAVAVEPSPSAARILRIEARLNEVQDRLRIEQAAAGEAAGWQEMLAVGVLADGYFVAAEVDRPRSELMRVRTVSIDSLVRDTGRHPTRVKIDVEGAEAAALRGGRETLSAEPRPVVFLELHNEMSRAAGRDPGEPLALLATYGYERFEVNGRPASDEELLAPAIVRLVASSRDTRT